MQFSHYPPEARCRSGVNPAGNPAIRSGIGVSVPPTGCPDTDRWEDGQIGRPGGVAHAPIR
jgi:hypothetical protein